MTTDPLTDTPASASAGAASASAATERAQRESGLMNLVRSGHLPLLILVFVAGIVSLGIEVSGGRLMAPYFGTTDLIWAIQIGSTLIYLSIGYWFGGRLADRYPSERVLCGITAAAGVATGLLAFVSAPVLRLALPLLEGLNLGANLDNGNGAVVLFGVSLLMAVLLFSIPVTLLGMVSPFAIRITVASVGSAGTRAGSLYALSTVGSILGAFLPVLWLIPWIGVRRTLLTLSVGLILASLWGLKDLWRLASGTATGVALLFILVPSVASLGPLKPPPPNLEYLYDEETPYNYIQVVKDANGTHFLLMNEGAGAEHSWYNPDYILSPGHYWYSDYMLTAPYFNASPDAWKVRNLAIIGLAGGTMARQFDAAFHPERIDGAEIDPGIIRAGKRYFGLNEPGLRIYQGDGRTFMQTTKQTYDVVAVDAFQQPYMPFQLTTREFYQDIKAHLSPTGVVTVKSGHVCDDFGLVNGLVNTLSQVFASVYVYHLDSIDTAIVATNSPTSIETYRANLATVEPTSLVGQIAPDALRVVQKGVPQAGGLVFTDDHAPVEQLTDHLLFSFLSCGSH